MRLLSTRKAKGVDRRFHMVARHRRGGYEAVKSRPADYRLAVSTLTVLAIDRRGAYRRPHPLDFDSHNNFLYSPGIGQQGRYGRAILVSRT